MRGGLPPTAGTLLSNDQTGFGALIRTVSDQQFCTRFTGGTVGERHSAYVCLCKRRHIRTAPASNGGVSAGRLPSRWRRDGGDCVRRGAAGRIGLSRPCYQSSRATDVISTAPSDSAWRSASRKSLATKTLSAWNR